MIQLMHSAGVAPTTMVARWRYQALVMLYLWQKRAVVQNNLYTVSVDEALLSTSKQQATGLTCRWHMALVYMFKWCASWHIT